MRVEGCMVAQESVYSSEIWSSSKGQWALQIESCKSSKYSKKELGQGGVYVSDRIIVCTNWSVLYFNNDL